MTTSVTHLDPEVVARISRLDLRARLVVEGFLSGLHHSPYKGFSQEFADHRQYLPGDEPKRVDWKVYGRTDRYYVKEYQEETNLRAYILLDRSASMGYGHPAKLEYAKQLCACLTYLLLRQKDGVGLITFDTRIREYIPPSAKQLNLTRILEVIDHTQPGDETSIGEVLSRLGPKIHRRGLVIVVSDLLDDPARVLHALRSFRYRKHEILVLQVLDESERTFPFKDRAVFRDMETGGELELQPDAVRASYQRDFAALMAEYRRAMNEARIDFATFVTSMPFDEALMAFLQKRSRLA